MLVVCAGLLPLFEVEEVSGKAAERALLQQEVPLLLVMHSAPEPGLVLRFLAVPIWFAWTVEATTGAGKAEMQANLGMKPLVVARTGVLTVLGLHEALTAVQWMLLSVDMMIRYDFQEPL